MRLRVNRLVYGVLFAITVCAATSVAAPREGGYEATGQASWYGNELRGQPTANGETFNPEGFTAAHRSLPLSSYVEVTALDTGKTILVRINDRGPYHGNRMIDLSMGAARQLGLTGNGARLVHIRLVDPPESARMALRRGQPVGAIRPLSRGELDHLRDQNAWSAPVSTRATLPAGGGPYFIRVGTFSSKSRAEAMAGSLGATLFEVGGLYQVRLGPYADAGKVNAALAPLAAKGYPDVRIVR